jgi:hypothetical protein
MILSDSPVIPSQWTDAERWAWKEIFSGRAVDFNARYARRADPSNPGDWSNEDRKLSADFIKSILAEPFVSSLQKKSIAISGARMHEDVLIESTPGDFSISDSRFDGNLFLHESHIGGDLALSSSWFGQRIWGWHCRVDGGIRLGTIEVCDRASFDETQIGKDLSITGELLHQLDPEHYPPARAVFNAGLGFSETTVGGAVHVWSVDGCSLSFKDTSFAGSAHFSDTDIEESIHFEHVDFMGSLAWHDIKADGTIDLNETTVGRDVVIHNLKAQALSCHRVKVKGNLAFRGDLGETCEGFSLYLEGVAVGGHMSVTGKLRGRGGAKLEQMQIGGNLDISVADCESYFRLGRSEIKGNLSFANSTFGESVDARLIRVGGSLTLVDTELVGLDLAGAKVAADFSLGAVLGEGPAWSDHAKLDLHNAEVGAISVAPTSSRDRWPKKLDLRGFTFGKLVAFGGWGDLSAETTSSLRAWLSRDTSGSVQPYTQLAKVLKEAGELEKANDILYAGRELYRNRAWRERMWGRWLGLSALKWTIGYGLGTRYFRVLYFVAALVASGAITLYLDQTLIHYTLTPGSCTWQWMIVASLDILLPIINLDKSFRDHIPMELRSSWATAIFWGIGVAGWVLGSFLVAGLAGLTQKQG